MPDCDYCGESFADEDAYLDHLAGEHEGELGAIDRRRVEDHDVSDDGGLSLGPVVLVGLLVLAGGLVVWVTFFMGSGNANAGTGPFGDSVQQPSNVGGVHSHGPMTVVLDGEELDFSQSRFQVRQTNDRAFHFEGGDGSQYHLHAQGVTLEYALESLDIGVNDSALSFDGTVYSENDRDTVVYEVNGQEVSPETYVIEGGDQIRVVANSSS